MTVRKATKRTARILNYTARPWKQIFPVRKRERRTSLCGFMLLSGDNLIRAQPIPFLSLPRHLRPSAERERPKPQESKIGAATRPFDGTF
jgi:hypothetical protein